MTWTNGGHSASTMNIQKNTNMFEMRTYHRNIQKMKTFIHFLFVFGATQMCLAQQNSEYVIKTSSLGSGGSSHTVETLEGTYRISQSIGQGSVIGTHQSNGYILRQGYQQPLDGKVISETVDYELDAQVFPNPFSRNIKITFSTLLKDDISITLYDITGKVIHAQKVVPITQIELSLNNIEAGTYFLKVTSGKKHFNTKLLKI
jgi:hypothetical protein